MRERGVKPLLCYPANMQSKTLIDQKVIGKTIKSIVRHEAQILLIFTDGSRWAFTADIRIEDTYGEPSRFTIDSEREE